MKKFVGILAAAAVLSSAAYAAYPDKPVNMIIPASAGGGYDMSARIVTDDWGNLLGKPFKYDYKPGASSMIGLRIVANDVKGYSVGVVAANQVCSVVKTQKNAPANWKNMAYVGNITSDPDAVFVHKDSPFKTIQDLVEYGKTHTLKVGTAHPSAVSSIAAKIFLAEMGIKANIVSFNGGSDSRKALAGKHVDMVVSVTAGAAGMREYFRGLVIFSDKNNLKDLYDMPTMKEAYPDRDFPNFIEANVACVSQKFAEKYPADYAKLCETFKAALASEGSKKRAQTFGFGPLLDYADPAQCKASSDAFDKVLDKYASVLK